MEIKTFKFLSFEEWEKTKEYSQKIGDYTCAIKYLYGGEWHRGEYHNNYYKAAIANYENPIPCYVEHIYVNTFNQFSEQNTLKEWYEHVTLELNAIWKEFIYNTYLN